MSLPASNVWMDEDEFQTLSQRGIDIIDIYENKLKALLEPAYNNHYVAIHIDSEEYEIARFRGAAMRAIRQRRPEGFLVLMKIGLEPEYGLAARILAGSGAEIKNESGSRS